MLDFLKFNFKVQYKETENRPLSLPILIKTFTNQANNYMQFVGDTIREQLIKGVTFCFSSKPPQAIIDALRELGVTVNWLK